MQIRNFGPILTIVGALDPWKREGRRLYFDVVTRKETPVSET